MIRLIDHRDWCFLEVNIANDRLESEKDKRKYMYIYVWIIKENIKKVVAQIFLTCLRRSQYKKDY